MPGHDVGIKHAIDKSRTTFVNRNTNILKNEAGKLFLNQQKQPNRTFAMTVLHCGQIEERNAKQAQPKHCLAPIHKQNAKKQGVSQKSSIHVGSLKQRTTTNNPDRLHTHGENKLICVHTGNGQKNNQKIAQMLWKSHTPTRAKVPPRSTHPYCLTQKCSTQDTNQKRSKSST